MRTETPIPEASDQARPAGDPPRLLLTAAETCRALAIGRNKLWSMTAGGELPCVRIGRAVRYDPRDLAGWIERMKKGGRR